jgi:hypothetical protein
MMTGVRETRCRGYAAVDERGHMTEQQGASRVHARDRDESLRGTETKSSYKTTELIVYVVAVLAVLIAALLVDGGENNPDPYDAFDAWRFVTYLTIGYMISRGLAKAGSRNPRDD